MLLSLAPIRKICFVKGIWAGDEIRKVLEDMGFTTDSQVVVLAESFEDTLIVGIRDKRIVIGKELACKIMV